MNQTTDKPGNADEALAAMLGRAATGGGKGRLRRWLIIGAAQTKNGFVA